MFGPRGAAAWATVGRHGDERLRIAVLTDVHGNRFALEAVLEDIETTAPDLVANLGDQVMGLADPAGAEALQRGLGAVEVRGNTEERLAAPREQPEGSRSRDEVELLRALLPPESVERLAALPLTATLADGEVLVCHGTPQTPWLGLTQVREGGAYGPFREATDDELWARLPGPAPRVVVAGHLHTEKLRGARGTTFVNAGPVAYQNDGDPAARWVLLERRGGRWGGTWSVSFRRVAYDVEAAVRWVERVFPAFAEDAVHLRTGAFPPRRP